MKTRSAITKVIVLLTSAVLSLLLAELALRIIYPAETRYYVWQPYLQHTFYPDSTIFYGISGEKNFSINAQGTRGAVFEDDDALHILCLGGSTTECLYLDDKETWFYHLQQAWRKRNGANVVVAGMGKSGCTTREHYIQLKYATPQLKKDDMVTLMVGLNDMMKRLSRDTLFEENFLFTKEVEDSMVNTIFLKEGRTEGKTWWRRTALFQLLQKLYHSNKTKGVEWQIQDDRGLTEKNWREYRQGATTIIDTLPDLTAALNEYERNLQLISDEAKRRNIKLTFVSQAAMYKDSMSAYENSLLWMGGVGNFQSGSSKVYYSAKALKQGLNLYNSRLESFCAENKIEFIDISKVLPQDTSAFYDDCHFNENGARILGEFLAR